MRELTYFVATTLDGRIAGPDGSFDFFPFDPGYGAALAARWGDGFPTAFHDAFGTTPPRTTFDAVVMGRGTFAPAVAAGLADPYEHLDTYVYSATLTPADHPDVTVVATDPIAHVRQLKQADGAGIWLCGGGRLAASLAGEVDRLVLKFSPVTIGRGRPVLDGPFAPQAWRLESCETFDLGVVLLEYRRVGDPADDPG